MTKRKRLAIAVTGVAASLVGAAALGDFPKFISGHQVGEIVIPVLVVMAVALVVGYDIYGTLPSDEDQ